MEINQRETKTDCKTNKGVHLEDWVERGPSNARRNKLALRNNHNL